MAKGKESAVSMFASMQKVNKMTEEVKEENIVSDKETDLTKEVKEVEKAENVENTDIGADEKVEKEITMTKKVNENKTQISKTDDIITSDIKTETEIINAVTPEEEEDVKEKTSVKADKGLMHIHIALPKDVFDKLETGKKAYYNNKTTYIRNLILNDYEKNKDYYESLPNIR